MGSLPESRSTSAPGVPRSLLAMVGALEPEATRELALVLGARLSSPVEAPLQRRDSELGFLASILGLPEATGSSSARETPLQSYYDEHRPAGSPSGRRLCSSYGSWTKACRAAAGFISPASTAKPWSHGRTGRRAAPRYTRDEVVGAVISCAAAIGRMPSSHAYYTWAAEQRRRAKKTGALARYPSQRTVEHHVGRWAEVRQAVEDALSARAVGRTDA